MRGDVEIEHGSHDGSIVVSVTRGGLRAFLLYDAARRCVRYVTATAHGPSGELLTVGQHEREGLDPVAATLAAWQACEPFFPWLVRVRVLAAVYGELEGKARAAAVEERGAA